MLNTAVQGRNGDDLDESVREALQGLGRCVDQSRSVHSFPSNHRVTEEIERTLRRGANTPRTKNNKSKAKGQKVKLKTQEVLDPRDAPNIPVDPIDSHGIATASIPESGASFIPAFSDIVERQSLPPFQLQYSSLRAFGQTHICSARSPLPDRGDLLESG